MGMHSLREGDREREGRSKVFDPVFDRDRVHKNHNYVYYVIAAEKQDP